MTNSRLGQRRASRPVGVSGLILLAFAACGRTEPVRRADSLLTAADSAERAAAPRIASDATLAIMTRSDWIKALSAVADAFAEREGVRVVFDVSPDSIDSALPARASRTDLVIDSEGRIRQLVATDAATWALRFADDRIVLAWQDSLPRGTTLDAGSWWDGLLRSRARVGRVDPEASQLGRRTLLAMQLAERASGVRRLATRLAGRSPPRDVYSTSDSLAAAMASGMVAIAWTYESIARQEGWRWLRLGDDIDLGDPARDSTYAMATISLPRTDTTNGVRGSARSTPATTDSMTVRGTSLTCALTIPRQAGNPSVAERFVRFLLSADGRLLLARAPFVLLDSAQLSGRDIPAALLSVPDLTIAADSTLPVQPPE
ncbi:MAG: hypothetical protein MNPFHGCM_02739 [Gemmatimonadaceae bacterium]|nr:hypothetical protein [Gemmatimonadaceae bacterium]